MLPLPQNELRAAVEDRTEVDPTSGCWLWIGSLASNGYGKLGINYETYSAHRLAFMAWCGPIPDGLVIDHKCRTPLCCNPHHLRAVTPRVNTVENSISVPARNAVKTHCKHGHEFTEANTYRVPKGRVCRACLRARYEQYRDEAKAAQRADAVIPRTATFRAAKDTWAATPESVA